MDHLEFVLGAGIEGHNQSHRSWIGGNIGGVEMKEMRDGGGMAVGSNSDSNSDGCCEAIDAAHRVGPAFDTSVGQKFEVIKSHFVCVLKISSTP
jgi:hypothetical protein